jgi:restriction system protein
VCVGTLLGRSMGSITVLLVVILVVLVLVFLVRGMRTSGPKAPSALELNRRLGMVRHMSGPQFEMFVADVLRALGYQTTILGGSGDQGVDVIAVRSDQQVAVQCKNYAKPVGNRPVQEVYAGARHHGCDKAMVVAPMGFTKGAGALAKSVGVELHDSASLRGWIRRIQPTPREQRTVDLDKATIENKEDTKVERNMEKHTISVGTDTIGETVRFTAKQLGTVSVNGGLETPEGMEMTFYRLPDNTYRVLVDNGSVTMLLPSNMTEALGNEEPIEYGRWTLEELEAEDLYGDVFKQLMETHPEGRKRQVRDLD